VDCSEQLSGISVRRLSVSYVGEEIFLHFIKPDDGSFWRAGTSVSLSLSQQIAQHSGHPADFYFELWEESGGGDPYSLVMERYSPQMQEIAVSNPFNSNLLLTAITEAFSIGSNPSVMDSTDKTMVINDGTRELISGINGLVSFSAKDQAGAADNLVAAVGLAYELVTMTLGPSAGDAEIWLTGATEIRDGFALRFDYFISGVPVMIEEGLHGADIKIINGAISEAVLYFRTYRKTDSWRKLQPEHVMYEAKGDEEPIVIYVDSWDTVISRWITLNRVRDYGMA
jgi:hypothetical protein